MVAFMSFANPSLTLKSGLLQTFVELVTKHREELDETNQRSVTWMIESWMKMEVVRQHVISTPSMIKSMIELFSSALIQILQIK